MLEKIESILREQCGLHQDATIVVGVSGGPDSLCLLHALYSAGCHLVVGHFNHGLRPEADREARQVQELAVALSIPCIVEIGDVRSYAGAENLSIEEAARKLRYRFLFSLARQHQAQAVAVGHTADDQVETVLMHFIRGAGLNGLKGMAYRTVLQVFDRDIPLIRPLLDVWREQILAYCSDHGLAPHYDSSNQSLDFLRNRLRHELIPALEAYNPRIRETIWRNARILASDDALLRDLLDSARRQVVFRSTHEYVAFDLIRLTGLSAGLHRHLIRNAAESLAPGQELDSGVLDRAASFISGASGARMDLVGGLELHREADVLYVARVGAGLPSEAWPQMRATQDVVPVSLPGRIVLAGDWQLESRHVVVPDPAASELLRTDDRFRVWLDAESLPEALELRVRRPGDRFEPLGLHGHSQKISDFFVNEKLPRRARARWPLVCAGNTVIWVPGYRPAESFKLRPSTRKAVFFSLAPNGQQ